MPAVCTMAIVSPSLLACDLADITNQVYLLKQKQDKGNGEYKFTYNVNTQNGRSDSKEEGEGEGQGEDKDQGQNGATHSTNGSSDTRMTTMTTRCANTPTCSPQWVHVDVMDGHFVPNLSFGGPVLASLDKALRRDGRRSEFLLDCHLMVTNPEMYVEDFRKAGADMFTFHHEAASRPEGTYVHICAYMCVSCVCECLIECRTRSLLLCEYVHVYTGILIGGLEETLHKLRVYVC